MLTRIEGAQAPFNGKGQLDDEAEGGEEIEAAAAAAAAAVAAAATTFVDASSIAAAPLKGITASDQWCVSSPRGGPAY